MYDEDSSKNSNDSSTTESVIFGCMGEINTKIYLDYIPGRKYSYWDTYKVIYKDGADNGAWFQY